MKKAICLLAALLLAVFAGCSALAQERQQGKYLQPAQLSEQEQDIAQLLGAGTQARIFDFSLDSAVQSLQVSLYRLQDGAWEPELGGSSLRFTDSKGRILFDFDRLAEGMRIAIQSEHENSSTGYEREPEPGWDKLSCATSLLSEQTGIRYGEEIPIAIQILTDKNTVRSFDPSYFAHPEEYAALGYEQVYALTLCFRDTPPS